MILTHSGKTPSIDPTAYVAPNATLCGDVRIGPHCRVMFGACVVAEGGSIELGSHCIVLENAVVRSTVRHSTRIGAHCLVGPNTHLVGCTLEDEVFVATGATILPPDRHDEIWAIQKPLNFPLTAYGIDRSEASMVKITERMAEFLGGHRDDGVG